MPTFPVMPAIPTANCCWSSLLFDKNKPQAMTKDPTAAAIDIIRVLLKARLVLVRFFDTVLLPICFSEQ